jgi:hypothetical protein
VMAARHRALRSCGIPRDNPVTYIQGHPPWGDGFACTIIHAVSPTRSGDVWTIMDGEDFCGRGWRRNGSAYPALQNISGKHRSPGDNGNRPLHVRQMLVKSVGGIVLFLFSSVLSLLALQKIRLLYLFRCSPE